MAWKDAVAPWEWIVPKNRAMTFQEKMDSRLPKLKYGDLIDADLQEQDNSGEVTEE